RERGAGSGADRARRALDAREHGRAGAAPDVADLVARDARALGRARADGVGGAAPARERVTVRASKLGLLILILAFGGAVETAWNVRQHIDVGPLGCRALGGRFYGP